MSDFTEQSLGCLCNASLLPRICPLFAIVLMVISRLIWVSFRLLKDQSLQKKYKKMALLFASVIFFVYLCSRKGLETSRHSLTLNRNPGLTSPAA